MRATRSPLSTFSPGWSPGAFSTVDDMMAEILPLRTKYKELREGLDRLRTHVLRQTVGGDGGQGSINFDVDTSRWRDRAMELETKVEDLKAQLGEQVASGVRHRQWSRSIKADLAETARLLQEKDEEAGARMAKVKDSLRKTQAELEKTNASIRDYQVIAKKARQELEEAENRRRIAEAAAAALEEELHLQHQHSMRYAYLQQQQQQQQHQARSSAVPFIDSSYGGSGGGGGEGRSSQAQNDWMAEQKTAWEGKHRTLMEENGRLKVEVDRLSVACTRLTEEKAAKEALLEKELQVKEHELGRYQERLRMSEEESSALLAKLDMERVSAEKEIAILRQSLSRSQTYEDVADQRGRKIDDLKETITALEEERKDLRSRLRKVEDVVDGKERQLSSLQAVVRERDQQLVSLEPFKAEAFRLREELAAKLGALTRLRVENESLQHELQRLSQQLIRASTQLGEYERRLCLLEEGALKDRERESELHSARKQLMKNRIMVESLLLKELSKVAPSSGSTHLWPPNEMMLGNSSGGGGMAAAGGGSGPGNQSSAAPGSQALPPPLAPSSLATPSTERSGNSGGSQLYRGGGEDPSSWPSSISAGAGGGLCFGGLSSGDGQNGGDGGDDEDDAIFRSAHGGRRRAEGLIEG